MQPPILSKLEASRKELLDLGTRNPLIHYRQPRSKGLRIVDEKSIHIFDLLVNQERAMSFLAKPAKEQPMLEMELAGPAPGDLPLSYSDTKLQTIETEITLQQKLLNTFYAARTSIEEQGVNTLFMALGMLEWYEADTSNEKREAPLVLVPVTLERSSARERFRVKYSEEEIGHNLSLQAKLKSEFAINLPELPPADECAINDYFAQVTLQIESKDRWQVVEDRIELGFFSFGKFMLFHDLNNNNWPEESRPSEHPLLKSLLEEGFSDLPPSAGDDAFIDTDTPAHELFQVVDADSTQLLALLAVHEGRNLVIQGPPGTGKSQTITNIIANAIGQCKKVLFVAEKLAALEVVKRRLDAIGLGEACLELHSHKANKKELHHELKRVLELGKPSLQKKQEEVAILQKHKNELNVYSRAMNTPIGNSGLTPYQVYGYLLGIGEETPNLVLPRLALPEIESWTAEQQHRAEAMASRIEARLHTIGVPSKLLFWGSERTLLLPHDREAISEALTVAVSAVENLQRKAVAIANSLGINEPAKREDVVKLTTWLQAASVKPDLQQLAVENKNWVLRQADIKELIEIGTQLSRLTNHYSSILLPEAWDLNVLSIRQALKEHGSKWYRFLIGDYKKALQSLKTVVRESLPKDPATRVQYTEDILTVQRLQQALGEFRGLAGEILGTRYQGGKTDWESVGTAVTYLLEINHAIAVGTLPNELLTYIKKQLPAAEAKDFYDALVQSLNEQGKAIQQVVAQLKLNEAVRFGTGSIQHLSWTELHRLLETWRQKQAELQLVIDWNNLLIVAGEENLECLTACVVHWDNAASHLLHAVQKTWYEYLLKIAYTENPSLRLFERSSHEEVVRQFRMLDRQQLFLNRAKVALKHWEGIPNLEGGGQVRILKGEFNKKARHKPVRILMQEVGHVIQAIKPVLMMSPLSIANYLSPGTLEFDLVIFDEASQVPPVEALGAILRGKQLVVVGDAKQLPPTRFFDTLTDLGEEEENVTADLQSILGLCDAQGAPQKMLRWHYRSRHQSLISLSNQEFYDNKLIVFPSTGSRQRMGLLFHHLPDTFYDRGQTRTNHGEAERVAMAVMEHAERHPELSLGVVSFSSAQREAIQNAVEKKRKAAPELEAFFNTDTAEPFFIKNLENVQGDERDVIFISVGYGRTQDGAISMNFGPLNNDGGERRLNVLITRAKLRCEVFTNITAANIDTTRTQGQGIKALKNFLHYAQTGTLNMPQKNEIDRDVPFEENVFEKLSQYGYTVHQQVGSNGFYLDLAVVDAEHPGRYLLGIECDGASYHSARSARDRDRLRQQVLENMGWRLHRIWSTDWFRNPDRELKRVIEAIEKAKLSWYREEDPEANLMIESMFSREAVKSSEVALPEYETAILNPEIATKELHQHTIGKLAGWIEKIVHIEGPVHFEEMARRMVEAAGISRLGSRIKAQLQLATQFAEGGGKIVRKGDFLWTPFMQSPTLRKRDELPTLSKKIKYISPEELELAIIKVVGEAVAIEPEAAAAGVAKLFGFSRVTDEVRLEIITEINKALAAQKILQEGSFLKLVDA